MNRITKLLSILMLSSCSTGHIVTTNLHNLASFEENSEIYTLPKTRVIVTLTVDKTEFIAGPYNKYAKEYLEIEGVRSASTQSFTIKDIQINTQSVTDPDYCFSLRNENYGEIEPLLSELRERGLIMNQNGFVYADTGSAMLNSGDNCSDLLIKPFSFDENLIGRNDFTKTQEFSQIPFLVKQVNLKTTQQEAEAAAKFIFKIRKRRFNLMAGKYAVMPEGIAAETSLKELNRLEEEYLSLFVGKKKTVTIARIYTVVPTDNEKMQQFTLLRFSDETGFHSENSRSGEAIVLQLTDLETNKTLGQLQRLKSTTQYYDVLHYRVADWANAKIFYGSHEVLESEIPIFQFGVLLPKNVSPKKHKLF